FSREVIGGYEGSCFLAYTDYKIWAEAIKRCYRTRKKFQSYHIEITNRWPQFFELIKNLIS
ncbi:MAG: hypothetical protein PHO28_03635, partial [Candidatus Pacebacteria bacterium]|nr:hypothetical protein [Candidatus Paceibacterota bacterium]